MVNIFFFFFHISTYDKYQLAVGQDITSEIKDINEPPASPKPPVNYDIAESDQELKYLLEVHMFGFPSFRHLFT
jgi:hypothetical protein